MGVDGRQVLAFCPSVGPDNVMELAESVTSELPTVHGLVSLNIMKVKNTTDEEVFNLVMKDKLLIMTKCS